MSDFRPPGSSQEPDQPNVPPGWYTDPWDPNAMRWWDGQNWGAQTSAANPTEAPGGENHTGLTDVGRWLGDTFQLVIRRAGHLFTIMLVTALPASIAVSLIGWAATEDLQISKTKARRAGSSDCTADPLADGCFPEYDFTGWDSSWLVPILVVVALSAVLFVTAMLAIAHQLHSATGDAPASWGQSLAAGFRTTPRWLVFGLAGLVAFIAVIFGVALLGTTVPVLGVILGLALLPLGFLLWIKFSFFTVAAAVAPKRTNVLSASWRISNGVMVQMIGRLILLFFAGIALTFAASVITTPITSITNAGLDQNTLADILDVSGESQVWSIGEIFGSPAPLVLATILNTLVQVASIALSSAGLALLYRQRSGPSTDQPAEATPAAA